MKVISKNITALSAIVLTLLFSITAIAQEKKVDVNIDVNKGGGGNWYTHPWVWIVGAAVFILLLVALLRGNNTRS